LLAGKPMAAAKTPNADLIKSQSTPRIEPEDTEGLILLETADRISAFERNSSLSIRRHEWYRCQSIRHLAELERQMQVVRCE
jgi:hypothetical protein